MNSYVCKPSRYRQEYGFTGSDLPHLVSSSIMFIPENVPSKEGLNQPKSDQKSESYSRTEFKSVFEFPQQSSAKEGEPVESQSPLKKTPKYFEKAEHNNADATKKNTILPDKNEDFVFEGICFKELENGKLMCGICEVECSRLIVHMNGNRYCTEYFSNMAEFKRKYSEFRDRMSRSKMSEKRKAQSQIDDRGLNQPNSNKKSESYSRTEIKSVFESPQQSSAKEGEPVGSQSPLKKTQNILKGRAQ